MNITTEGIANYKFAEADTKKHFVKPVHMRLDQFPETDFFDYKIEPEDKMEENDVSITDPNEVEDLLAERILQNINFLDLL
jgi:hypothetical protein